MKKYLPAFIILAFTACTNRESSNNNEPDPENQNINYNNNDSILNRNPAGNPVGNNGDSYDAASGKKPDTSAKGTRIGNTCKSGDVQGQYMKVIKPGADTGSKPAQQFHSGEKDKYNNNTAPRGK
jgi:hypothetical protein